MSPADKLGVEALDWAFNLHPVLAFLFFVWITTGATVVALLISERGKIRAVFVTCSTLNKVYIYGGFIWALAFSLALNEVQTVKSESFEEVRFGIETVLLPVKVVVLIWLAIAFTSWALTFVPALGEDSFTVAKLIHSVGVAVAVYTFFSVIGPLYVLSFSGKSSSLVTGLSSILFMIYSTAWVVTRYEEMRQSKAK